MRRTKDKLEELEQRIRELEARPVLTVPVYIPQPYYVPLPQQPSYPYITWGSTAGGIYTNSANYALPAGNQ